VTTGLAPTLTPPLGKPLICQGVGAQRGPGTAPPPGTVTSGGRRHAGEKRSRADQAIISASQAQRGGRTLGQAKKWETS